MSATEDVESRENRSRTHLLRSPRQAHESSGDLADRLVRNVHSRKRHNWRCSSWKGCTRDGGSMTMEGVQKSQTAEEGTDQGPQPAPPLRSGEPGLYRITRLMYGFAIKGSKATGRALKTLKSRSGAADSRSLSLPRCLHFRFRPSANSGHMTARRPKLGSLTRQLQGTTA